MESTNVERVPFTLHTCKQCGGPVVVVEGGSHRPCGHDHAAIIANIRASMRGVGGVR